MEMNAALAKLAGETLACHVDAMTAAFHDVVVPTSKEYDIAINVRFDDRYHVDIFVTGTGDQTIIRKHDLHVFEAREFITSYITENKTHHFAADAHVDGV